MASPPSPHCAATVGLPTTPHRDGRATPRKKPPDQCRTGWSGGLRKRMGGALLSRAPERSTIAACSLNGRVREGNGCLPAARATNPKRRKIRLKKREVQKPSPRLSAVRKSDRRSVLLIRIFHIPLRATAAAVRRRGKSASRTAYQNRSGEALADLAPPACQPGSMPGAFRSLAQWDDSSPGVLGA